MKKFLHFSQHDRLDCGPACLKMISRFYGQDYSYTFLKKMCRMGEGGTTLSGLQTAADAIGLQAFSTRLTMEILERERPVPLMAHWHGRHYVVVYNIKGGRIFVADPAKETNVVYTKSEFEKGWICLNELGTEYGIVTLFSPTPEFYASQRSTADHRR
ncbi:cysteine peptidase family C39 domain-containing protein [Fulvivirgaceae bacterium BMA12]|uniref:Cysteine peptidase family C39 domain-containing protein n=1 Tax=Agaribacillus aureus TaxID=3051825 RepID=A0ABT8LHX9_9BACT|nr:cysteine peptidase family C39 domain-containing protein [Fulvivirgaceae bacterium BMA12]